MIFLIDSFSHFLTKKPGYNTDWSWFYQLVDDVGKMMLVHEQMKCVMKNRGGRRKGKGLWG